MGDASDMERVAGSEQSDRPAALSWHYDSQGTRRCACGGEVYAFKEGLICSRCRRAEDPEEGSRSMSQSASPMLLAYADPPYPGQAKRHYADHPDYAGEVDHLDLIENTLSHFDGWALSTSNRALQEVLSYCPPGVRILSWHKPIAPPMSGHGVFGWEAVIVRRARPPASDLRDTLVCSPEQYTFRPKPEGYVTGSKPPAFCSWMFRWLGARPGDEFEDLFPGSRAVTDAWARFDAQGALV